HSIHGQNLVFLADIRTITNGDRQIVPQNPVGGVAVSDRALDDLLHEEGGHSVRGHERDVACAFEQFASFVFRRECGRGRIYATALSFFERASQQWIVTALRSGQRAHAVSERKTDATLPDLLDEIVARVRAALELIE